MTTQSEKNLEDKLIESIVQLGYSYVEIKDESDLVVNLKIQIEKLNTIDSLSDSEFVRILNILRKGGIYDKAKTLRQEKIDYQKDDGTIGYISLFNQTEWCKNIYQVTRQVTMHGKYENRYDVTLLINGLPLVQIELKRKGLELKEAFNQTNRYERHSYSSGYGLFNFIQLFVISNGVNTKYYANNKVASRSFKQTFYWSDENNNLITHIRQFAYTFLDTCHISKMITRYIVLNETYNVLMVLRPYQYYAVERIVAKVESCNQNGFIWHTTGSGKTLTSFKASQIITQMRDVEKVLFVVDRKDLDYQTTREFNSFSHGSIDGTANTKSLVAQLEDDSVKLIVTTLQKLEVAIRKDKYSSTMNKLQNKRVVFIFDECHRSQFGSTHQSIKSHFNNAQLFGFTGTPILKDNYSKNKYGNYTTESLFGECLHKYIITDAIRDENVLRFSVEYIRTYKKSDNIIDIEVEAIDTKEVMESPQRLEKIVDYIINNHDRKTHNKKFTAIMCVSSIPVLVQYYDLFKTKEHDMKIATIFSYQANEEDKEAKGALYESDDEIFDEEVVQYAHSREKLDEYISHYNDIFKTNFSTKDNQSFYNYYNDISKRVKSHEIDILIVVNMFLTGFDSPYLNTLYVDKNLKYHGLIQAFSRTNRILDELKSQGNIVCFRNLKSATDDAITLFSNKDAVSEVVIPPYEEFVKEFDYALNKLYDIAPTVESVNSLVDENEEFRFIKSFRQIIRLINKLTAFTEFSFDDIALDEQTFNEYKSKYLDLYDKVKDNTAPEKVSILNDINFELELIQRDEINVAYILGLLAKLKGDSEVNTEHLRGQIEAYISNEVTLRSKKELIEKFIIDDFMSVNSENDIEGSFYKFIDSERIKAIEHLSYDENLDSSKLHEVIKEYQFTKKEPLTKEIIEMINKKPSLKERKSVAERITDKIKKYVDTFINGL